MAYQMTVAVPDDRSTWPAWVLEYEGATAQEREMFKICHPGKSALAERLLERKPAPMIVLLDQQLLAHMHKAGIGLADAMERETMFARFAMLRRDGKAIDGDGIESIGVYDLGEDFGVRTVELRYK